MKISKIRLVFLAFFICGFSGLEIHAQEFQKLTWHGYFGWNYISETKHGPNPNSTFDPFVLALIPKFTLSDKIDVYSQIVFEHAPYYAITALRTLDSRSSGQININDAYITFTAKEWFKIRAGKFATPFGLWNTMQFAVPTYPTLDQPGRYSLYTRGSNTDSDANLFQRYSQGAWILGEKGQFTYDLYVANGKAVSPAHIVRNEATQCSNCHDERNAQLVEVGGAYKDDNESKALGCRIGYDLPLGQTNLKMMYSHNHDKYKLQSINYDYILPSLVSSENFIKQYTNAFSAEYNAYDLGITSELANSDKNGVNMRAFYVMTKYNVGENWIPFLQYQIWAPDKSAPEFKTRYYTYGFAYQILPWQTLLKIETDYVKTKRELGYYRMSVGLAASF
ncbi:MAG: hypothetical protein PHX78_10660 [bacterium]|nr:hypothetical protein [bacterium]